MDSDLAKKLQDCASDLEWISGSLQYQVLNNLDGVAGDNGQAQAFNDQVKKPIMKCVTRLKTLKHQLIAIANNGRLPSQP